MIQHTQDWSSLTLRPARRPYPVVVGAVAAATGAVALADALAAWTPFTLFVGAVAVSAAYGGFRPGIVAAALAALASNFLFVAPRYELSFDTTVARLTVLYVTAVPLARLVVKRVRLAGVGGLAAAARRRLDPRAVDKLLAGHSLFRGLSVSDRAELAALLVDRHVPAGTKIYAAGDGGADLYLVRRGRVEVSYKAADGELVTDAVLGPGRSFGEVSLLDGGPRGETTRAVTDADLLVFARADLWRFLLASPSAGADLIAAVASRQRGVVAGPRPWE